MTFLAFVNNIILFVLLIAIIITSTESDYVIFRLETFYIRVTSFVKCTQYKKINKKSLKYQIKEMKYVL